MSSNESELDEIPYRQVKSMAISRLKDTSN